MSNDSLENALRKIYGDEALTRSFADNPKGTLETLGVEPSTIKVGKPIIPSPEEVGQICGSVCPGIPIINACLGYGVGKDV